MWRQWHVCPTGVVKPHVDHFSVWLAAEMPLPHERNQSLARTTVYLPRKGVAFEQATSRIVVQHLPGEFRVLLLRKPNCEGEQLVPLGGGLLLLVLEGRAAAANDAASAAGPPACSTMSRC